MKNRRTVIILLILVLIVGWFIGWISNKNSWISYSSNKEYGVWEIIYYIAAILTAFGTVGAVFVALFKERIIQLFSSPDLTLEEKDEKYFCEDVDAEQQNPTASKYLSILHVTNKGNVDASGCEICIAKVLYAKGKDRKLKDITDTGNKRKLFWESAKVDLPVGIPKQIWLFRIDNPNSYGTPSSSNAQIVQPHLQLNGMKLKDNQSEKGIWEIIYYISNNESGHSRFKLTIEWNGEWKTRKTEMTDVLKVNFETL